MTDLHPLSGTVSATDCCAQCNKPFSRPPYAIHKRFCSSACRVNYNAARAKHARDAALQLDNLRDTIFGMLVEARAFHEDVDLAPQSGAPEGRYTIEIDQFWLEELCDALGIKYGHQVAGYPSAFASLQAAMAAWIGATVAAPKAPQAPEVPHD